MKPALVTAYMNPDLDAVACIVGYAEYLSKIGVQAEEAIFGEPHDEAKYVLDTFHHDYPKKAEAISSDDRVVLVDTSELAGLPEGIKSEQVVEIIDHRKQNDSHLFPNAKLQIEMVGSAATLIAEKFHAANMEISERAAILLYAAIVSNTLNFKAKVATERDIKMAEWLKSRLKLPDNFIHDMFAAKSDLTGDKLSSRMKSDFAWFNLAGKRESIIQLEIVDADKLVRMRKPELLKGLQKFDDEMNLDVYFVSIIDLLADRNFFVTADALTQQLVSDIFNISFTDNVAMRPGLIMRKEITPLIKEYLEHATR